MSQESEFHNVMIFRLELVSIDIMVLRKAMAIVLKKAKERDVSPTLLAIGLA